MYLIKVQGGFQRPGSHKSKWLYIKRLPFPLKFCMCLYLIYYIQKVESLILSKAKGLPI